MFTKIDLLPIRTFWEKFFYRQASHVGEIKHWKKRGGSSADGWSLATLVA